MKRKSSSQERISNPGNPAQALRIDAAKACTRGCCPGGGASGLGCIEGAGTEWNFATQF